jgi:hypothetical protein
VHGFAIGQRAFERVDDPLVGEMVHSSSSSFFKFPSA